jgi:hypothetical protein
MKKILLFAVLMACFLSLFLDEVFADDATLRIIPGSRMSTIPVAIILKSDQLKDLDKKIEEIKKLEGVEEMELRLYIRDGKILLAAPVYPDKVREIKFIEDLSEEQIREVAGVAIKQKSPGCTYWYGLWGWEKICY